MNEITNVLLGMTTLFILGIMPASAFADTDISIMSCKDIHVLVERPNGKTACVYENTAEKLGWKIIPTGGFADDLTLTDPDYIIPENPVSVHDDTTVNLSEQVTLIRINSTNANKDTDLETSLASKAGELFGYRDCRIEYSMSVEVPDRARVGELFNVTAYFTFEDVEFGINAWKHPACPSHVNIQYPTNYQVSGDELSQSYTFVKTDFAPPIVLHGMYRDVHYKQEPITFQMRINEIKDGVYDVGASVRTLPDFDPYDLSTLLDEDMYDIGEFRIILKPYREIKTTIYTSISDGIVSLSEHEFASGQNEENKPVPVEPSFVTEFLEWDASSVSSHIPFEMMAESIEEYYTGQNPVEFIKRFGLNDTYVEDFLEAYPKFKTQSFNPVLNWILPQVFGQTPRNLVMVVGNVMSTNPDGDIVPVYGLNVTALDVSYPQIGTADYIYLGETADGRVSSLVSDITDKNGNFKLIVPLIDLQGDSTTPDLLLGAIFDSDDFLILKHGIGDFGINRNVLSTHSVSDVRARPNISGPFFDYGTFELPRHSIASSASYILNSLQPVHDWYASDVGYAPDRLVINWTPDVCVPFGVDPTSNVLDLHKVTGHDDNLCDNTLHIVVLQTMTDILQHLI